jgi:tetratricopeptide (TPR) repeat protein
MRSAFSIVTFSAAAALILTAGAAQAAEPADELIKKGDVYYARLQADEALKFYLPAEKLDPNNAKLLVRISREYRHLMSDATKREDKLRLGGIAVDYSRRAVALAPNDPEAQLSIAISYGKVLPLQGNRERMENSRLIKAAAEKVIQLDPRNDLGWHVLGRWYFNMANVGAVKRALAQIVYGKLPAASNEDAVRCFEKAIEMNPKRLMHYVELGRTYAQMGRTAEARKFISKGLTMTETEKDDPETKNKGREVLEKLR